MAKKDKKKKKGPGRKPENMPLNEARLLRLFKEVGKPLPRAEVVRHLKIKKRDKQLVRDLLKSLVEQGKLIHIRRAYGLPESMHLITGKLQMQRSGVGFVIPEDNRRNDIFVSQKFLNGAWHGDKVVVAIIPGGKGKNPEGRIARIVERGRKLLPVRVFRPMRENEWLCRPTDPLLPFGVWASLADGVAEPSEGDVCLLEPGKMIDPTLWEGTITEILGQETDLGVQEALVKSNQAISTRFNSAVLEEAEALPELPRPEDYEGREDLREVPFVTIDGATARDFDDAVHVERMGQGYRLRVAIADVSHYVRPGSAMDAEALERGNSYYFPLSVEPMFPKKLSNGLCSLNPNVDRLAMNVTMEMDENGAFRGGSVETAVIRSHARMTYGQMKRVVLDRDPAEREAVGDLLPMLDLCEELARKMNLLRKQRGSLDFDLPEPNIQCDEKGRVLGVSPKERHFANQIIEEFMVAANEAVASFLEENEYPCMFRIHPPADSEKLQKLYKLVGYSDPSIKKKEDPSPQDLQELLKSVEGTDREFLVNRLLLRSMKQAKYDPENSGHYGLASDSYCHFTSPIRRYADLVVHRSVKAAIGAVRSSRAPLPGQRTLLRIAGQLNGRERTAMESEREIRRRAVVLYMKEHIGERFKGVISQVTDYGFRVELKDVMAEGIVRLSTLEDDYYTYWAHREMLVGERTGKAFRIGQSVEVVLEDASLARVEISLALSPEYAGEDFKGMI